MTALRRVTAVVFALSLGLAFTGSSVALAQFAAEPGTTSGASVTQTGWWWKANDNSETPDELRPGTDAVPPPPPPKNVPENTLPVAANAGEPDKVSAIQFALDAEPGAQPSSFLLSLRENGDPGANLAADSEETAVVACDVTETFWTGGEAAAWQGKPDHDDAGCQQGQRNEKGVWTFDLTTFAMDWLSEGRTSGSVLLMEDVDEPMTFQVVFDGHERDGVGTLFEATPGSGTDAEGSGSSGELGIATSGGGSGGATGAEPAPPASGGVPAASSAGIDAAPPQAAQAPAAGQTPQQPQQPQAAGTPFMIAPSAVEDIPAGVWVLAPLMLGIAYLMMLALGPAGEPTPSVARRGVSKALERLRSTGTKTAGGMR